uniref:Uncharacterized protein n=2 Tax=Timema TaxID=61471 RepID=A0A7R9HMJ6_9NEOP|nr:unnamed protein product [Timema cristinae]CAD7427897.1 unnamed protein product [Timema monikensis]
MKRVFLAACTLVAVLGLTQSARLPREDRYSTKYDNVNLKEILESDRLRKSYLDCLLVEKAPCTPDAKLLKESIPDALINRCSKCSDKQKEGTKEVIHFLYQKKPEEWKRLQARFDPQNTYYENYKDELKQL